MGEPRSALFNLIDDRALPHHGGCQSLLNGPLPSEAEIFLSVALFKSLSDQGPSESPEPLSREAPRLRHEPRTQDVYQIGHRSEEQTSELQSPCNLVCR